MLIFDKELKAILAARPSPLPHSSSQRPHLLVRGQVFPSNGPNLPSRVRCSALIMEQGKQGLRKLSAAEVERKCSLLQEGLSLEDVGHPTTPKLLPRGREKNN